MYSWTRPYRSRLWITLCPFSIEKRATVNNEQFSLSHIHKQSTVFCIVSFDFIFTYHCTCIQQLSTALSTVEWKAWKTLLDLLTCTNILLQVQYQKMFVWVRLLKKNCRCWLEVRDKNWVFDAPICYQFGIFLGLAQHLQYDQLNYTTDNHKGFVEAFF